MSMASKKPVVISVVGARPQFVKLAALAKPLSRICRHIIVHSGQHYDYALSQAFFKQLRLPQPDYNLQVGSGSHGQQTGRIMQRFESLLKAQSPDIVLVYGDTNTTLAGALAAAKLNIPIGHVEAGLRSFRRDMPEEINRRLTDHMSTLLFYPTSAARTNLRLEGITSGLIYAGDVMYEILEDYRSVINNHQNIISKLGVIPGKYYLTTLHRAENTDTPEQLQRFLNIMKNLPGPTVFLMHPRTSRRFRQFQLMKQLKSINKLIIAQPQPYRETLQLISQAAMVMTDSGGMQKEACYLGRPCLILRRETEWVETLASGTNVLVDLSLAKVRKALRRMRPRRKKSLCRINGHKPSEIICQAIADHLRNH